MSLLTKLGEKFKNMKAETKKRITATILAGGIALSGLGMAGCNPNENNNNTNPPIVNPGDNNGGTQTPSTPQAPDYSKFSQALQNVINDQYYVSKVVDNDAWDGGDTYAPSYENQSYDAIPYGFLEDEGFNITDIKNNRLHARSEMYLIDNDLHMEVRVENKASKNYYTSYILKYSLTEQEIEELNVLFSSIGSSQKTTFIQAPLFIQELSYLKTPTVLSKSNIAIDSVKHVEQDIDRCGFVGPSSTVTCISASANEARDVCKHTYQIHKNISNPTKQASKGKMQIAQVTFKTYGDIFKTLNNDTVNCVSATLDLTEEEKAKLDASYQTVDYFTSTGAILKNIFKFDNYENNLFETVND